MNGHGAYAPLAAYRSASSPVTRPSAVAAARMRTCCSRPCTVVWRSSTRSLVHFSGRPSNFDPAASATSSGYSTHFGPNPPPTSGEITRTCVSAIPRCRASPVRTRCGTWLEIHTVSSSPASVYSATTARASIAAAQ